jgi:zinc transporter 2
MNVNNPTTNYKSQVVCKDKKEMLESIKSDHYCHTGKKDLNELKKQNAPVIKKLVTVLVLCILFMVGEIVGGIFAGSISIQTDAAHMAADIAGLFFSILAIVVSEKS